MAKKWRYLADYTNEILRDAEDFDVVDEEREVDERRCIEDSQKHRTSGKSDTFIRTLSYSFAMHEAIAVCER